MADRTAPVCFIRADLRTAHRTGLIITLVVTLGLSARVFAVVPDTAAGAQETRGVVTQQGNDGSAEHAVDDGTPPAAGAPGSSAANGSGADQKLQEVVVTGSNIVRNGFAAPTPVTVASAQKLLAQTPSNIADGLNKLPLFFGSQSQTTQLGANNTRTGNYLNLRSFGFNRVLVLEDGHRLVPTSLDNTVDVNTIPQLLLQRVDIVTAGASAVYGADAVTGVVNFITDTKFEGLKGLAQGGISQRGDDASQRFGVAYGTRIGDRGHFEVSAEYYNSAGITTKEARPLGNLVVSETGAGTAANPYVLTDNARISNLTYGGLIASGPLKGQMFLPGGGLAPFDPGTPTGSSGIASGGDGAYYKNTSLTAGLRTAQAYERFDYQLTDQVNVFMKGSYADSLNQQIGEAYPDVRNPGSTNGIAIFSGNAFLPPAVQSALTANNAASFQLGRLSEDLGARPVRDDTSSWMVASGATGRVFDDWKWDLQYEHGESRLNVSTLNNINNPRFYAAVDAVRDSSGNIVCRVTLTNPGLYPGCAPLNLFGVGAPSQAAIDYISQDTPTYTVNELDDFTVNFSGDLMNLWAGPVSAALGGEFRKASLVTTSPVDFIDVPSYTGLRGGFNPTSTLAFTGAGLGLGGGSNRDHEISAETVVPLLSEVTLAKSLEINAAARDTDYRIGGNAVTWKVGLNYQPLDDLRLRTVVSRDIRAPTLNELFAGTAVQQLGYNDPHTGVSGSTQLVTSGNPNLVPEVARTYTAGFVYRPHWLDGLGLSVDYFNIKIDNAIASVGGNNAQAAATCEQSNGASPICLLLVRPLPFSDRSAANFPTELITENLNVGTAMTNGVDFDVAYRLPQEAMPGIFNLALLGTYQPNSQTRTFPGTPLLNNAGSAANNFLGLPKWRLSMSADYAIGIVSFDLTTRYRSAMLPNPNPQLVFINSNIPAQFNTDLSISVKVPRTPLAAFFVVNNLFDTKPAPYGNLSNTASPGAAQAQGPGEDVVLRYFTAGFRFEF